MKRLIRPRLPSDSATTTTFTSCCLLFLLMSGILLVPAVMAQETVQRVTLEQALDLFNQNNLELKIARAGADEMSSLARQAVAYPNPSISLSHEPLFNGSARFSESYFNLSQRIEWPALRSSRSRAANEIARASRSQVKADSLRLAFDVARFYIEAVAAEKRVETLKSVTEVFREAERAIVERLDEGDVSGYDVRRLRVERSRYENSLALAELGLYDLWRNLATLILPEGESAVIAPAAPLTVPVQMRLLGEILRSASSNRPEISYATQRTEAVRASVDAARASRLPSPTVTAGFKRQSDGFSGALFGLAIPVPVFNRYTGMIEARLAELHAAETQLILVGRQIENDVQRAFEIHSSLKARVELIQEGLLADAEELLDIAQLSYDEGEMTLIELLDAAGAYRDARLMKIELKADFQISYYDLLRAAGGVDAGVRGTSSF